MGLCFFTDWKEGICVRSNLFVVSVREKEHLMLVVLHCGSGYGTSLSLWFAVLKSVCVCVIELWLYTAQQNDLDSVRCGISGLLIVNIWG